MTVLWLWLWLWEVVLPAQRYPSPNVILGARRGSRVQAHSYRAAPGFSAFAENDGGWGLLLYGLHISLRLPRRISALLIALYIRNRNIPIMGKHQPTVVGDHVVEQGLLFLDQG